MLLAQKTWLQNPPPIKEYCPETVLNFPPLITDKHAPKLTLLQHPPEITEKFELTVLY